MFTIYVIRDDSENVIQYDEYSPDKESMIDECNRRAGNEPIRGCEVVFMGVPARILTPEQSADETFARFLKHDFRSVEEQKKFISDYVAVCNFKVRGQAVTTEIPKEVAKVYDFYNDLENELLFTEESEIFTTSAYNYLVHALSALESASAFDNLDELSEVEYNDLIGALDESYGAVFDCYIALGAFDFSKAVKIYPSVEESFELVKNYIRKASTYQYGLSKLSSELFILYNKYIAAGCKRDPGIGDPVWPGV